MSALETENLDLKDQIARLTEENRQLKEEIRQLKQRAGELEVVPTHRNILYSENDDVPDAKRLPVYEGPNTQKQIGSMTFGECFAVTAETPDAEGNSWLKIAHGDYKDNWVLGQDAHGKLNCVKMMNEHAGRIPESAFAGQEFPKKLYTEGFAGPRDVCLISASGDSFWREINIEMLFRGIATATVFEQDWGGDATFTDWVAYYAVNCVQYGKLRTPTQKTLVITVKPTADWAKYQQGLCKGPELNKDLQRNIGKAQYKECDWLKGMKEKLHVSWEKVEFVTGFTFLQSYCEWTADDCKKAAGERLAWVLDNFFNTRRKKAERKQAEYELERAYWLWDEAFHGCSHEDKFFRIFDACLHAPRDWLRRASAAKPLRAELADVAAGKDLAGCLAGGLFHSLFLVAGSLRARGHNSTQQCDVPTLPSGSAWAAVSARGSCSLGLTRGGELLGWGDKESTERIPTLKPGKRWAAASAGHSHCLGLTADGALHAWGNNNAYGQCNVPGIPRPLCERWAAASAGRHHSLGITTSGTLRAWGRNDDKQCNVPALRLGERWARVSAGYVHSMGLTENGRLLVWGNDEHGQCSKAPALDSGEHWVAISAGGYHSLGLTSANRLHAWGYDKLGQCTLAPTLSGERWLAINAGDMHSLGLTSAGNVWLWGWNRDEQCGERAPGQFVACRCVPPHG